MDIAFLDNKISKKSQLRIIVGLLCILILYTLLIKTASTVSTDMLNVRNVFFNLADVLVFLYLYKFIRYDLKLKLYFIFISIVILIHVYFILTIPYKAITSADPDAVNSFVTVHMYSFVISSIRLIGILGIAIQMLLNKYFKKKIKIVIQVLGASFLLQLIGPVAMVPLMGILDNTTIETSVIDNIYRLTYLVFTLFPYVSMVYLYVLVLDQDYVDISVEEEL